MAIHSANTLSTHIAEMKEALKINVYQIDGFSFVLDTAPSGAEVTSDKPHVMMSTPKPEGITIEQMTKDGFYDPKAPTVNGFIYISNDYAEFLAAKAENAEIPK